jgi:hypothetical protein
MAHHGQFVCATYLANPEVHAQLTREPATRLTDKRVQAASVRWCSRRSVRGRKPEYTLHLRIDAEVTAHAGLQRRWQIVDTVALYVYGRRWERLHESMKTRVMECLNGVEDAPVNLQVVEHLRELLLSGCSPQRAVNETRRVLSGEVKRGRAA